MDNSTFGVKSADCCICCLSEFDVILNCFKPQEELFEDGDSEDNASSVDSEAEPSQSLDDEVQFVQTKDYAPFSLSVSSVLKGLQL